MVSHLDIMYLKDFFYSEEKCLMNNFYYLFRPFLLNLLKLILSLKIKNFKNQFVL